MTQQSEEPYMSKHTRSGPAAVALAAVAGLVLAGCGASAATSGTTTPATAPGHAATSTATTDSGGVVSAASLPFPVAVGNTWVYESSVPSAGSTSTVTNKILSVVPVAGGNQVTESYTDSLSSSTTRSIYIFHSDGTITFPLSQATGGMLVSSSGGILLPSAADIATGKPYRSVLTLGFKQDGQTVKEIAHVTVQGAGTATVTVPAGTYRATIVNITMVMTVSGITVSIEIRTWVANGVGQVKSEVLTGEADHSAVTGIDELKSFTKG
jgi:hypothetical protein